MKRKKESGKQMEGQGKELEEQKEQILMDLDLSPSGNFRSKKGKSVYYFIFYNA